ncbi:heparinase II/III domain-containing protein [Plantactinospora sp. CA-290183]|uniref:heparinase II/III domain-containing protein n=1 Tax=Plantactinospora sp. CA-290183 TaxID=3240006 RepID=UPI003D94B7D2
MEPLLIAGRLDALRAGLGSTHAEQWRRLHEQCDWYRGQTPPAEHPTASITYLGPAAANLALAYRLTGQRGYLDEAWRWISTAVSYPHWGKAKLPDHDLDAGWLLHGLSLAYSWLRDDLPPERAEALRDKLILQGRRLHDFAVETEGSWWSSSYWQNHNWICYTGLATAGYALDRPEWARRAKANMADVLDLMPADGSDSEGVVYWRYGVPWLAAYVDLLQHVEGDDWWHRGSFLRNTFDWRLHQCAPGFEENVDHGDCHDRRSGHSVALYYKLASAYRCGEAQWLARTVARRHFWREAYASGVKPGVMPEAYYELLWYDPGVPALDPAATKPTTAFFPDLGQVTARTSWADDATYVSFKAAPGGGHGAWEAAERFRRDRGWETLNAGHHHPDAGSFVLVSHGAFLAVDEGYSNRKRAGDHNLVLVDGQGWAGEGRYHVYKELPYERQPRMRDVHTGDGWVHATAESALMFDPSLGVRRVDRTLVVTPAGRLVLLDLLAAEEPREWTFLLHSDWPATIGADGRIALRSGPAQGWLTRLAPDDAVLSELDTPIEANPTASTPSLRMTKTLRTLRISTPRTTRAHFLSAIEPTSALDPAPPRAVAVDCASGYGVDFGDEAVYLAPVSRRIAAPGVEADATAVLISGGRTVRL